jgi:hypothetical protein
MLTVYISANIDGSYDKAMQACFLLDVDDVISRAASTVKGMTITHSGGSELAGWRLEITESMAEWLRDRLASITAGYEPNSIAWEEVMATEYLHPSVTKPTTNAERISRYVRACGRAQPELSTAELAAKVGRVFGAATEGYCLESGRPVRYEAGDRCLAHGAADRPCRAGLRVAQCQHPHLSPNHPYPHCSECGKDLDSTDGDSRVQPQVPPGNNTPRIGRIVHYVSYGTPGGEYPSMCRAAVITAVDNYQQPAMSENDHHIGHVSLCVLNPEGVFLNKTVLYRPEGSAGGWHWPECCSSASDPC